MFCFSSEFFYFFIILGMATLKENKGKEIIGEEGCPEAQPQTRLLAGEKRKSLLKNIDLGSLPNRRDSRRDKRVKRGSS